MTSHSESADSDDTWANSKGPMKVRLPRGMWRKGQEVGYARPFPASTLEKPATPFYILNSK